MKKFLFFVLMMLPLALASCGDDKDEPKPSSNTTNDPTGTVIVNVSRGSSVTAAGLEIKLTDDYNLRANDGSVSIVGPVKGIANINCTESSVKSLTWTSYAAAEVGYGYIMRQSRQEWVENRYVYYYDIYAVYVDSEIGSTSGGVLGYKLKVRKLLEKIPSQN